MRLHVDTWDPLYGAAFEAADEPESDALHDVAVELPPQRWRPLTPTAATAPRTVFFVDGVRRIDAFVWLVDDGAADAGLCASYAAGVVRCDEQARIVEQSVRRGLFTPAVAAADLRLPGTNPVDYQVRRTGNGDPDALRMAVQDQLGAAEVAVAELARSGTEDGDDLLVVDGPLRGRTHLPRTVGYVKSQERRLLPAELDPVISKLRAGERTPVFSMGSRWGRYAWYVRLPGGEGPPWAGVVRIECAPELVADDAVALADRSAVTLPRFASREHREPRAPQNLVPIAGLERALRSRLGDARLLRRSLRAAAASVN